jgi:hypothetical protein
MDTKILITNLNQLFCEIGKKEKTYSKVWLEDADFGGLYHSNMYILYVKARQRVEDRGAEISNVLHLLDKNAKEELKYIWRVVVYNPDQPVHSADNIVYEMDDACS